MVDLAHLSRCKADLVAVGAVALGGTNRNLLLRELSGQRLLYQRARVGGSGHTHCLIDIGTSRERIADRTAKAGRRTAERLDLRRMIVRLVLEHEEPVLIFSVYIHGNMDAARVDLLRHIEIVQLALRTQCLHPDHSEIHQRHIALFIRVECLAVVRVLLIRLHDRQGEKAILDGHRVDRRGKRRMTAVIRPIRVDDAQLRDRRCAALRRAEVLLHKSEILLAHGKTVGSVKTCQLLTRKCVELRQHLHIPRHRRLHLERCRRSERRLAALHAVDEICLDLFNDQVADPADEHDDACRAHRGTLPLRHELHALRSRRSRRVELPRQRLDGKDLRIGEKGQCILIDGVNRWIGKDDVANLLELLVAQTLHIVARNHAYRAQVGQTERLHKITAKALCRNVKKALTLFDEDSLDGHKNPPSSHVVYTSILTKFCTFCNDGFMRQ